MSKNKSMIERISGSTLVQALLTIIGAANPTMLPASLLPVLSNSLAASRYKERIDQQFQEIKEILDCNEEKLRNITDEQFQIINDLITISLQTINQKKLEYLKYAVSNSIRDSKTTHKEASMIGRIIRDISAEEAYFLINNFEYKAIALNNEIGGTFEGDERTLVINRGCSQEESLVIGLMSIGLLVNHGGTWDGAPILVFSDIAAKIIALLQKPN